MDAIFIDYRWCSSIFRDSCAHEVNRGLKIGTNSPLRRPNGFDLEPQAETAIPDVDFMTLPLGIEPKWLYITVVLEFLLS